MSYAPFILSSRTIDAISPVNLTVNATVPADTAVSFLHAGEAGCAGAASSYAVVTQDHELEVALEPGVYKLCVAATSHVWHDHCVSPGEKTRVQVEQLAPLMDEMRVEWGYPGALWCAFWSAVRRAIRLRNSL